ncbi:MAG TPA: BamA/TamA family outer membrane protein [Candidatus Obscuribacterales bacterium]
MPLPAVAIFTLAVLTSCGFSSVALAKPNPPSGTQKPAPSDLVVPIEETSASATATSGTQKPGARNFVVPSETTTTPKPPAAGVNTGTPPKSGTQNDVVIRATDVQVVGATEELQQIVRNTIATRTGGNTSQSQVQKDVAAILATGLFANANATTQSTPAGLKVVYQVQPMVVRSLQLSGAQVLTQAVVNDSFKPQLGKTVSPATLNEGVQQLNQWYSKNGYVLAQVASVRPSREGVVLIEVAEGLVGEVNIRFFDKDGKPTKGRTKPDYLTRQLKLKPGQVFHVDVARGDLQSMFKLGLFDKADISLSGDPKKVGVTYDLTERPTRAVNAGGGYSADTGIVGNITYRDQNLGGVGQQVGLNVQASFRDLQFDGNFTNPYNSSDPNKLGYTINGFRRRGLSDTFDEQIKLANGDRAREGKFGGGITLTRPLGGDSGGAPIQASVGLNYTRTSIRDRDGNLAAVDAKGNQLSYSPSGIDDLVTVSAGISRDQRNNSVNPTSGSVLSLSTEQSVPIGQGNILMNRLQANYSQYVPTGILSKNDVLAFNVQGGTTIGDLPPYQAFNIGGPNSVRAYGNGEVASGRSYVLASAEYRFPIFSVVGGVLFADYGSDLGSGDTVPGQPGVERGKPGSGFAYGAGMRLNSPLGIIRADFGINDQGVSRLQFGVGQRF